MIKSSLRLERPKGISGDYHQASRVNIKSGIQIKTERFRVKIHSTSKAWIAPLVFRREYNSAAGADSDSYFPAIASNLLKMPAKRELYVILSRILIHHLTC